MALRGHMNSPTMRFEKWKITGVFQELLTWPHWATDPLPVGVDVAVLVVVVDTLVVEVTGGGGGGPDSPQGSPVVRIA
jgi:hypothetical protein